MNKTVAEILYFMKRGEHMYSSLEETRSVNIAFFLSLFSLFPRKKWVPWASLCQIKLYLCSLYAYHQFWMSCSFVAWFGTRRTVPQVKLVHGKARSKSGERLFLCSEIWMMVPLQRTPGHFLLSQIPLTNRSYCHLNSLVFLFLGCVHH